MDKKTYRLEANRCCSDTNDGVQCPFKECEMCYHGLMRPIKWVGAWENYQRNEDCPFTDKVVEITIEVKDD